MTQSTIFGGSKMNDSPTAVANRFFSDWEENLQAVHYSESNLLSWFSKWFVTKYGVSEEAVEWLMTSRIVRTLKEIASEKRSLSGR